MKIIRYLLSFALIAAALPLVSFAQTNLRGGQSVSLEPGEIINDNYFAAGDSVNLAGTVNGDAYVVGGNVTVSGTVNGDVLAAGGNITITGRVSGDVRTAGGQTTISGQVGRNVSVAGGQIVITPQAQLGGSLSVAGGQLTVGSSLPGNLVFAGGNLVIQSPAKIAGNVSYYTESAAQVESGATVSGQLERHQLPTAPKASAEGAKQAFSAFKSFWQVVSFVSTLALGLLLLWLIPGVVTAVSRRMGERFWPNMGIGFVVLIAVPVIFIALVLTILGIPLAFMALLAYFILLYVARIFAAVFVGKWLISKIGSSTSTTLALVLGLVIYYLLGLIPFIGPLVRFGLMLSAVGALIYRPSRDTAPTTPNKRLIARKK